MTRSRLKVTRNRTNNIRKLRRSLLGPALVAAMAAFLLAAPVALAQDPLNDPSSAQYDAPIPEGQTAGAAAGGGDSGDSGDGLGSNIGSLPFTGMDLIIVAGVAFILTGTGFALRRLSTPRGRQV
jgi:hypothetical protein